MRNKGSYYDILMVSPFATDREVRDAYHKLSEICDPKTTALNKRVAALRYRLVNEAYATLRTEEGRARYNRLLLMRSGKPKGLKLRPDNDNFKNDRDRKIWTILSSLVLVRQSRLNEKQVPQIRLTSPVPEKDRDHG